MQFRMGFNIGFVFMGDGAVPVGGVQRPQVDGVAREKQVEGPVDRHPQFAFKAGQFHQVDGPPEPPGDEAGELETENLRYRRAASQTGE